MFVTLPKYSLCKFTYLLSRQPNVLRVMFISEAPQVWTTIAWISIHFTLNGEKKETPAPGGMDGLIRILFLNAGRIF